MKILKIIFFLFGLMPLLPFKYKSAGLVAGLIYGIYLILDQNILKKIKFHKNFLYGYILFFIYLLSFFISENKIFALKYLETSLAFILFPSFFLLISGLNLNKTAWKKLEYIFYETYFISAIIYSILIFAYVYHLGYFHHRVTYDFSASYLSAYFWGFADHPIYSSMFLTMALFFNFKLSKNKKIYHLIGTIIILSALFFLARKGVILAGLIAVIFYVSKNFKPKIKYSLLTGIVITFIVLSIIFPENTARFSEIFKKDTYSEKVDLSRSTSIRFAIYNCSADLIDSCGLLGIGIGDVKNALNKCFIKKYPVLKDSQLNTHNVYFNILIGLGWIGFGYFLYYLYALFKIALKNNDYFFAMIIVFFSIIFLFENVLDRQNGVILFNVLINLFTFKNTYFSNNNS